MKRKITFLLAALLLSCGLSWAQQITWSAADQGYENGTVIESVTFDSNVSGTFDKGTNSNAPKYYATGTAIRCYGGNYFTISTSAGNLTSIAMTFSTGEGTNAITTDVGSYEDGTWSGEAQSVTFTIGGTSGHRRIASFTINYSTAAATVAMPTFNPASGTEFGDEGLQVSIACATEGVDIYYTLDGSEPDDESISYSAPISLTETTTIKAIAYDGDDNNSAVATATYTYVDPNAPGTENNPYTVAQARAAIDANAGTQGVYATGIVSAIPTAYSSQHSNITFNMVDEEGDEDFLQAYRCSGEEAANVAVGDVVLVYGNLTLYTNSNTGVTTYEFAQGCTLISLTHPTGYVEAPTFSPAAGTYDEAQNVTISCANANATIYYTLDGTEPTNASTPYTTAINVATTTTIKAIAYVGANASTVTTAEYTIVPVANISSITEVGTSYVVKGTVVATSNKGFVMGDGTGYVYYYKSGAVSQSVGDMVKVSGTTGTYGQIIQFTNTATVTEATTSNYNGTPAATVITEVPDYTSGYHLSTYFEFEGELTKSNNNYFITLGESQIQISYPTSDQGTALTALNGKTVHVKGYFTGINSSSKFTVMLESVEEVVSTEPSITLTPNEIIVGSEGGRFGVAVTLSNITFGTNSSINVPVWDELYEWIHIEDYNSQQLDSICFTLDPNTTDTQRSFYFELRIIPDISHPSQVSSNQVTVTQEAYVAPSYAVLPFEFNGVRADIENTDGLTQEGLGTDYNATTAPNTKLKFDGTGDWLLLQFDEEPGTLTFDIKGNGFNDGTFTVQTSEDGETYEDLAVYTELGDVDTKTFDNLNENVRYIKWVYTQKVTGNVGLGNIHLYEPGGGPVPESYDLTVEPFENLEIFTFVGGDENNPFEGAGTIQVTEGDQVMLSITANEGYVIQSLMVDGVEHVDDITEEETYTFTMPGHNVTISATAVEDIPFEPVTYTLATSIESGKTYIIVGKKTIDGVDSYYAMGEQRNNNRAGVEISVDGTTATVATADVHEVVITALEEEGFYSIYDGGYLYAAGSSSNYLRTEAELDTLHNGDWEISIDTLFHIVASQSSNRNVMQFNYNSGAPIFSCYGSASQSPVYLYVKNETPSVVTQTVALAAGTNWFSTYLEITLADLQAALVEALPGTTGMKIATKTQNTTYNGSSWRGSLRALDVAYMYKITVPASCEITLEGMPINPAEHPITIPAGGAVWIGFPFSENMTPANAFAGFAVNGDKVSSKDNSSTYTGRWRGNLNNLEPGKGYIYKSAATESRTLVFPTSAK